MNPLDPLYIPPRLLHRDREIKILNDAVSQESPFIYLIYGVRGIGKTVLPRWTLSQHNIMWSYSDINRLYNPLPRETVVIVDNVNIENSRVLSIFERARKNNISLILIFEMLDFLRVRDLLLNHVDAVIELDVYSPTQFWEIVADRLNIIYGEVPRVIYDFIADLTLTFDSPRPGTAIQIIRQCCSLRRKITPRMLINVANELGFIDGYSTDLISNLGFFTKETLIVMNELAATLMSDDIPYFSLEQIEELFRYLQETCSLPYSKERVKMFINGMINTGIIYKSQFRPNYYFSIVEPDVLRMAISATLEQSL